MQQKGGHLLLNPVLRLPTMASAEKKSAAIPPKERPLNETFTLPDLTPINVTEVKDQKITISIGQTPKDFRVPASKEDQERDLEVIVEFMPLHGRRAKVNLHGSNDNEVDVWELRTFDAKLSFQDIWCALYGFWIRRDEHDRFPIQVGSEFSNQEKVFKYLIFSGLGFHSPDAKDEFEVMLDRSAFWQGAGAPLDRSWIRSPQPHPAVVGDLMTTSFPHIAFFTKSSDPAVLATHPLRPPKPPAGAIIYSRYIHSAKAHFQLFHIDPSNEEHISTFTSWMSDDRVSAEWGLKGDKRSFLQGRMEDPHAIACISTWDGEYAGYGELSWGKEDGISAIIGGLGEYDQTTRSLVGKDKDQDHHRIAHSTISMKHFCFLREARTSLVVSQASSSDLSSVEGHVPENLRRVVDLPSQRAAFVSAQISCQTEHFADVLPSLAILFYRPTCIATASSPTPCSIDSSECLFALCCHLECMHNSREVSCKQRTLSASSYTLD